MPQYIKIENLEQLKELASKDPEFGVECFVALGVARSSKRISITPGHPGEPDLWHVYNEIDDTWQEELTEYQLKSQTNLITAIESGRLYKY